jgi:glycosyltransferase involved in cell wall biosynthesis
MPRVNGHRRALRIAQVAPVAARVQPGEGDSVEQLVGPLTEGLIARGHDVTLYATADSQTSARLRAARASGYGEEGEAGRDWYRAESFNAALAFSHASEHDVIHAHGSHFALPFAPLVDTPLVETPYTEIPPEVIAEYVRRPQVHVVAMSDHQQRALGNRPNVSVIPHGIDFDVFPFSAQPEGYLLFLGRMLANKGPAQAIRIAREARMPLILAGPAQDGYDPRAESGVDGEHVRWVGWVDPDERNRLLAGAVALLFPLVYPKPFGLVPLEAMACGTPVLATAMAAAPELIDPGVTGFIAASWSDLVERVPAAAALDRRMVRRVARRRFDAELMVDRHEALYQRIVEQRSWRFVGQRS